MKIEVGKTYWMGNHEKVDILERGDRAYYGRSESGQVLTFNVHGCHLFGNPDYYITREALPNPPAFTVERAIETNLSATTTEQSTSKSTFGPASVVKRAFWFHIGCDSAARDAFRDSMKAEKHTDFRFVLDGEVFDVSLERLTQALAYLRLLDNPKRQAATPGE